MIESTDKQTVRVEAGVADFGVLFWKVEGKLLGGHVHVAIRVGHHQDSRPKLGDLIMAPEEWRQFAAALHEGLDNIETSYDPGDFTFDQRDLQWAAGGEQS